MKKHTQFYVNMKAELEWNRMLTGKRPGGICGRPNEEERWYQIFFSCELNALFLYRDQINDFFPQSELPRFFQI